MTDAPFVPLPLCVVFSEDGTLCRRLADLLRERAYLVTTPTPARLRALLTEGTSSPGAGDPVLLFLDLRLPGAPGLIPDLVGPLRTRVSTVAVGRDGSTPFAQAEEGRLYRVVDAESIADHLTLSELVDAALDRINLQQENGLLRAELARARAGGTDLLVPAGPAPGGGTDAGLAARQLVRPARHTAGPEVLFANIVDGAASALTVARVGIFHSPREGEPFRLRAGRHCLDLGLEFAADDPLVRWLERFRQAVSRRAVETLGDPSGRFLLRRALDMLGAENLVPLFVRERLAGWLFTGAPFEGAGAGGRGVDFHSLSALGEHVVAALENNVLYEEAALQNTLVESVLGVLPTSIIAVEPDGAIRWANPRAQALFPVLAESHRGRRAPMIIEDVSSRLAGLFHAALAGDPPDHPVVWEQTLTARTYSARAHAPRAGAADFGGESSRVLGVFVLIEDITEALHSGTRREVAARQSLCADISAGLAHEIRNPLVTLKTFAQLLPQRHADPEFRQEFSALAEREINRLEALLEKLDAFAVANKPPLLAPVNILDVLRAAEDATRKLFSSSEPRFKINPNAKGPTAQSYMATLPLLFGDAAALARCFTNLFVNGVEAAMRKGVPPLVTVDVVRYGETAAAPHGAENPRETPARHGTRNGYAADAGRRRGGRFDPDEGIRLAVADNGTGIPPELLSRVFSPFCTSKVQGLGLGLPEAQQIVLEHGGRLELDAGTRGVCANVILPLQARAPETAGGGFPTFSNPARSPVTERA